MQIRNTFIIFLVSGFWHGANWTFIIWGGLNALYILPSIIFKTNRNNLEIVAKGNYFPTLKELTSIVVTFSLTVLAWIFFRADSVNQAINYIQNMFSHSFFFYPDYPDMLGAVITLLFICILVITEWLGREQQYALAKIGIGWKKSVRFAMYYTIIVIILYYSMSNSSQDFIYFQF